MDLIEHVVDGDRIRRMIVRPAARLGWDVSEEIDSRVLRAVHCDDWHRVERMLDVFELTAGDRARDDSALER